MTCINDRHANRCVNRGICVAEGLVKCQYFLNIQSYLSTNTEKGSHIQVNERAGRNPDVAKYLGIYFAFGVGSAALVVLQTLILWIFCSIEVSATLTLLKGPKSPCPSNPQRSCRSPRRRDGPILALLMHTAEVHRPPASYTSVWHSPFSDRQ